MGHYANDCKQNDSSDNSKSYYSSTSAYAEDVQEDCEDNEIFYFRGYKSHTPDKDKQLREIFGTPEAEMTSDSNIEDIASADQDDSQSSFDPNPAHFGSSSQIEVHSSAGYELKENIPSPDTLINSMYIFQPQGNFWSPPVPEHSPIAMGAISNNNSDHTPMRSIRWSLATSAVAESENDLFEISIELFEAIEEYSPETVPSLFGGTWSNEQDWSRPSAVPTAIAIFNNAETFLNPYPTNGCSEGSVNGRRLDPFQYLCKCECCLAYILRHKEGTMYYPIDRGCINRFGVRRTSLQALMECDERNHLVTTRGSHFAIDCLLLNRQLAGRGMTCTNHMPSPHGTREDVEAEARIRFMQNQQDGYSSESSIDTPSLTSTSESSNDTSPNEDDEVNARVFQVGLENEVRSYPDNPDDIIFQIDSCCINATAIYDERAADSIIRGNFPIRNAHGEGGSAVGKCVVPLAGKAVLDPKLMNNLIATRDIHKNLDTFGVEETNCYYLIRKLDI